VENSGILFLTFKTVHFPYLVISKKENPNISGSLKNVGDVVRKPKP
jgi:hypothetical protein